MTDPARKPLKKDQAYQTIRQLLLDADDPEVIYSERFLAAELEMGLAPVRSAVERLRSEGIVEMIPKSGVRIPQITYREVMDFFEVRMLLEPFIAGRLAGQVRPVQAKALKALIADQRRAATTGDTLEYHRLDLAFHSTLAEMYGNREMVHALSQMRDKMYRLSKYIHRTHPDRLATNVEQHEKVVLAILDGSCAEARQAMETHLQWGRDVNIAPADRR
ncbi:GntR family transcriptional regulator [Ponticoccus alexandrii]|uniref:FCD domain-containing protein n=1 Tax=Ponticoccus alexandrii TaxID=1943633 RepID=A0ABX7F500_9RHOB|nr:GntR family transcriptional regulator [Ponticoccus alexandrii]QRF65189.1 FCD domain-containing protein [Ponticoccus alexandrii]